MQKIVERNEKHAQTLWKTQVQILETIVLNRWFNDIVYCEVGSKFTFGSSKKINQTIEERIFPRKTETEGIICNMLEFLVNLNFMLCFMKIMFLVFFFRDDVLAG